jgi:hypothetical protein
MRCESSFPRGRPLHPPRRRACEPSVGASSRKYEDRSRAGIALVAAPVAQIGDRPAPTPQPYAVDGVYAVGDRVAHPKFGIGDVSAVVDGKIEVRFPQGPKVLANRPKR